MLTGQKYLLTNILFLLFTTSTALANSNYQNVDSLEQQQVTEDSNKSVNSIEINEETTYSNFSQITQKTENYLVKFLVAQSNFSSTDYPSKSEGDNHPMGQITSVSHLSDVTPSDWAFQALQSLVERYGCIAGYPNGIFAGNRAITRYEFAAGLNACLERVKELIGTGTADLAKKEDFAVLQKLTEEFASELATLRKRVENLETHTGIIEKQQFSTTTKLGGEVIFALTSAFGGNPPGGTCLSNDNFSPDIRACDPRKSPDNSTTFANLVRLGLETSFTGKDRLRTYLTTGNFNPGGYANPSSLDTNMARLSYQTSLNNQVRLDLLEYRFPAFNNKTAISVIPVGFQLSSVLAPNSAYFDTGRGAISAFAEVNPIFKIGGGSSESTSGAGIDWAINNKLRFQMAYGTGNANLLSEGFTQSDRSVLGVNFLATPTKNILMGLTYVNGYTSNGRLGTFTGSINAESSGRFSGGQIPLPPTGALGDIGDLSARTHAVGGSLQWRIFPKLTFGAWGGLTFTNYLEAFPDYIDANGNVVSGEKPYGNTQTYLFSLGLSEPFGRKGDLFAILVGMPPKLTDAGPTLRGRNVPFSEISRPGEPGVTVTDGLGNLQNEKVFGTPDEATSIHYETFYRFRVNDNLFITPGFFVVTNPGHIKGNDAIFIGTIRTTFRF